jgi:hypothetical protein
MRKVFEIGGLVAAAVLIVFGVVAIVMGVNGRNTVSSELKQQQIVGTPDMTPSGIKAEAQKAGLKNISFPTCSVANQAVNSGARARCFAQYMRIHALEATGGYVYSQMGIYTAKPGTPKSELMPGGGTENTQYAAVDPKTNQPIQTAARNVWVTDRADDRTQLRVHGRPARALRDRRRSGAAAHRGRLRDPRGRWSAQKPRQRGFRDHEPQGRDLHEAAADHVNPRSDSHERTKRAAGAALFRP